GAGRQPRSAAPWSAPASSAFAGRSSRRAANPRAIRSTRSSRSASVCEAAPRKVLLSTSTRGSRMKLDSLEDVFVHQLNDLYSAEDQLVEALPKMAEAASNGELRKALEHHLQATKDAALIAAAQRVEHYEIAAYGTARTLAGELGHDEAKDLLDQTLDEESNADKLLTKIATGGLMKAGINEKAK